MARPTLFSHRKLLKLAQRLQSRAIAVGSLELIWHFANESGTPILGDADDIEGLADWRGERGELVAALMECGTAGGGAGFIERRKDGRYEIHDYWHHAPDYVRKRAKRERERREAGDELSKNDRSVSGRTPQNGQSVTGQNGTRPPVVTGQNRVGSPENGDFGRTPAPAPAPISPSGSERPQSRARAGDPDAPGARTRARRNGDEERSGPRRISGGLKRIAREEDPEETRRKVLKALAGGLDAPTVAMSLHVPLEQVQQWQEDAQS
jgi:hypothetical protein